MSRHEVPAYGLNFHCQVDGHPEAPWLVFSNSIMTDLTIWDAQVAALCAGYRILRYDHRGHGATDVPGGACTSDQLADDLIALCDWFQIERAVVIGVSMGGVTALRAAERYPARIAGVVALDSQWCAPVGAAAVWDERIRVVREHGMEVLVEPTIARWFTPAFLATAPPSLDRVRSMIRHTPVEGFVASAQSLRDYDVRPDWSRLQAPVCMAAGASDGALPGVMRAMHRALPGSTFVEIAGAGHLPHLEKPAEVQRVVDGFLQHLGWIASAN